MEPIKISAKTLGAVAMPEFCPRCFYVKMKSPKIPWQIFPGIFSSIDAYTKHCVHASIKKANWLSGIGNIVSFEKVRKSQIIDEKTNIILTGIPDDILICDDGSTVIPDYKTAKHTATQDKLFPMYEAQLNSYARIYNKDAKLFLVYFSPSTDEDTAHNNHGDFGFSLPFVAHPVPVSNNQNIIDRLLATTREICDLPKAPRGAAGCKDCEALESVIKTAQL